MVIYHEISCVLTFFLKILVSNFFHLILYFVIFDLELFFKKFYLVFCSIIFDTSLFIWFGSSGKSSSNISLICSFKSSNTNFLILFCTLLIFRGWFFSFLSLLVEYVYLMNLQFLIIFLFLLYFYFFQMEIKHFIITLSFKIIIFFDI